VFYFIATVTSGVVGIAAYASLVEFVTALTGSAIVICIGVLLIAMGVFQAVTSTVSSNKTREPTVGDAVLVGIAQGVAILPGVTRSGMTTGTLLLRGHDGPAAFRYSFILSIPAALGGGLLGGLETGISGFAFSVALAAFVTAALVGLVSIEFLIRIVERVAFSVVCLLLGTATVLGGVVVL
jgi:undecaprenyl-diphosphatase